MRETVAIIGSHPRTRAEFDFSRTDCDIWVFNEAASGKAEWVKRCDAVFQMHAEAIWKKPLNRNDTGHFDWLKTQTAVPVYMQDTYPEVPMSVRYPLDEIRERFGLNDFTSSVAYAIALGCHLGYKRIEIYGVEMETNTEYQYQRDGVTLWVGVARGLGIEVDAHMTIFDQPLYGYEGEVVIPYDRFRERTLGPLFINSKQIILIDKWLTAESHKTKGYAFRPGWHCCLKPHSPHLKRTSERVWALCEVDSYEMYDRPSNQGGTWVLAKKLRVLEII